MSSNNVLQRCKPLLGTYVEISVQGNSSDEQLIAQSQRAFQAIEDVQSAMSFHDPSSELSRLNLAQTGQPIALSCAMTTVLQQANTLYEYSDGLFDLSVAAELIGRQALPSHAQTNLTGRWHDIELNHDVVIKHRPLMLDLGGIAKGFAVDQAINSIDPDFSAVVNAGGDLRMTDWQGAPVLIRTDQNQSMQEVTMQAAALASSGDYFTEHGSVIIDPHTSQAATNNKQVSVFAPTCMLADALTKLAWLGVDFHPSWHASQYKHK